MWIPPPHLAVKLGFAKTDLKAKQCPNYHADILILEVTRIL